MQKNKVFTNEEILAEIKKLSEKAKEISGHQGSLFEGIGLGDDDLDKMFDVSILDDTANPDVSHRLYYTMMMTLRNNLPQGKANEKLRRYVYDEKSLFLNRGKDKNEKGVKNSDERQSYIPSALKVAFDLVYKWVSQGADPFDIYSEFRMLNENMGYRKSEKTDEDNIQFPQMDFGEAIRKISKAGKPK